LLGATYERPVIDLTPTVQADEINRSRFEKAFPELRIGSNQDSRCAVRSVWSDRLPAIGASEQKKIYLATGYASRGLLWAALGAQIIQTNLGLGGLNFKLLERLNPTR
jgi:tRNA 5-methylaminomethyl-2-thiouridine biosynthesis bifunctional protein